MTGTCTSRTWGSHTVTKYSPDGELLMTLGNKDQPSGYGRRGREVSGGEGWRGRSTVRRGLQQTRSGEIFISDGYLNARVHKFAADGTYLLAWGAPGKTDPSHFHNPHGIRHRPGRVGWSCATGRTTASSCSTRKGPSSTFGRRTSVCQRRSASDRTIWCW